MRHSAAYRPRPRGRVIAPGAGAPIEPILEETLARSDYAPFETRAGLAFAVLGLLLGIGTIVVIIAHPAS
jgi:hypothetical protein